MNWVDLLVLLVALAAAVSGARQGLVTAVLSFGGVIGGAALGLQLAPLVVEQFESSTARITFGVAFVVLLVALGEGIGVTLGRVVRDRLDGKRLRQAESALGAVVQAAAALVVAWLVALPLTSASSYAGLSTALRESVVLQGVDVVMPPSMRRLPSELTQMFDVSGFPDVLAPFAQTPVREVGPVDPALLDSPVVEQAQDSVLKVRGRAPSCSRLLEGTSFVVADDHVLTNAHVVAGTEEVWVETAQGRLDAEVVRYDPGADVAVLEVPGLDAPPLPLDRAQAESGLGVVILGYPLDGPYTATAGRVRDQIELRGPNIYGTETVVRDVYTIRAQIRSGNSGGPMLDPDGEVRGMVFGAAIDDSNTGFALTVDEIVDDVAAAPGLTQEVDTGTCAA